MIDSYSMSKMIQISHERLSTLSWLRAYVLFLLPSLNKEILKHKIYSFNIRVENTERIMSEGGLQTSEISAVI